MKIHINLINAIASGVALLILAGCGGGSATSAATTTPVTTTVVDGAIRNALVCLDKNSNGKCDADEVQGQTDALGNVTLAVPVTDVGKYPIIAVVGTDAVDAENGPVTVAYTMAAPADQSGVVSPLTTLVQQTVASTGASTADAAKSVQDAIGVTVSLFTDFTKVAAPTDGSLSAKTLARLIVVTTQAQSTALASAVGTTAIDGATITKTDLDKVIQQKLIELLPTLVSAMSNADVLAATTHGTRETALAAAAANAVTNVSGLTAASLTTLVAVNNAPVVAAALTAPTAAVSITSLNFASPTNYYMRLFTSSIAQNTPDANGNTRYVERRISATPDAGNITQWGAGIDATRNADLRWNGTRWTNCPLNFENTAGPGDAKGSNVYNYCDGAETGKSKRASFDIGGKTMSSVYARMWSSLKLTNPAVLAGATFPSGATLTYQRSVALNGMIGYYPGGWSQIRQYRAGVPAAVALPCFDTTTPATTISARTQVKSFEDFINDRSGLPCYTTAADGTAVPAASYGNSILALDTFGTALMTGSTLPRDAGSHTDISMAFKGTGINPVTYYQGCNPTAGSLPCQVIGTGSYTIKTLGDARVLTLNNLPAQAAGQPITRVFVERGGFVHIAYQYPPGIGNSVRLNSVGAQALLTQLGIAAVDPEVPMALTLGAYQGYWRINDATRTDLDRRDLIDVSISPSGAISCGRDYDSFQCTLTITNISTGAFTLTAPSGLAASGRFDFSTGTGTGTYRDPLVRPADTSFTALRG